MPQKTIVCNQLYINEHNISNHTEIQLNLLSVNILLITKIKPQPLAVNTLSEKQKKKLFKLFYQALNFNPSEENTNEKYIREGKSKREKSKVKCVIFKIFHCQPNLLAC